MLESQKNRQKPLISGKTYDTVNVLVKPILPGVATLYLALSEIWNLSYGNEVVATLTAVTAFLGLFLRFSDVSYQATHPSLPYDGEVVIEYPEDGKELITLKLDGDPAQIKDMKTVSFSVNKDNA